MIVNKKDHKSFCLMNFGVDFKDIRTMMQMGSYSFDEIKKRLD